jgi:thioredoxin-related protein
MRKIIFTLLTCWLGAQVVAAEEAWQVSLPEAMAQAKQENKLLLLDFTGSDWCHWCKKMDAETFAQPEFIDYARQNLVLVRLDFPAHSPQAPAIKAANHELQNQYGVRGYPTVVILKSDGTLLWKHAGFIAGGPAALIAEIGKYNGASTVPAARVAPAPAAPAVVVTPNVVPIKWPDLPTRKEGDEPKLQGIFYSVSHPSVMLDGQSCTEGESVHGMHVIKIARDKVTVVWNGTTKELTMN